MTEPQSPSGPELDTATSPGSGTAGRPVDGAGWERATLEKLAMATLDELEETARLWLMTTPRPQPLDAAQIDALRADAEVYRARMEGAKVQAEIEKTRIDRFKVEVDAHAALHAPKTYRVPGMVIP